MVLKNNVEEIVKTTESNNLLFSLEKWNSKDNKELEETLERDLNYLKFIINELKRS